MFETIGEELAKLGPIGLLAVFATLTGITGTSVWNAIRSRTRAGQLETENAGLEARAAREKDDRLKAERRAEVAEQQALHASPAGVSEKLAELRSKRSFDEMEQLIQKWGAQDDDCADAIKHRISYLLAMLSAADETKQAVVEIQRSAAAAAHLRTHDETFLFRLFAELESLPQQAALFQEQSTSPQFESTPNAAEADLRRLLRIAKKLYADELKVSSLPHFWRAFEISRSQATTLSDHLRYLAARDLASVAGPFDTELSEQSIQAAKRILEDCAEAPWAGEGRVDIAHLEAGHLFDQKEYDRALKVYRKVLPDAKRVYGEGVGDFSRFLRNMSDCMALSSEPDIEFSAHVMEHINGLYGAESEQGVLAKLSHARMMRGVGKKSEAIRLLESILPGLERHHGSSTSPGHVMIMSELKEWRAEAGEPEGPMGDEPDGDSNAKPVSPALNLDFEISYSVPSK